MFIPFNFHNSFTKKFSGDFGCYSIVAPTKVAKPEMLVWSEDAAKQLDLLVDENNKYQLTDVFSGNLVLPGMVTYSTRYGGYQFGHWAGQLGDGRAISLGEIYNSKNETWEIQLKGAGLTPYSRRGDGRAVMRSSMREFLCSEAMHFLGIPTTRALTCVATGEWVERDFFYDGNPKDEPGAITTRLAPTFIRFGNFEIMAANQEIDLLRKFTNYVIATYYPEILLDIGPGDGEIYPKHYKKFFESVCVRTAHLVVDWLRVGFIHGVMNTDNMSILGYTIDYGPYGWLDPYDPEFTPNTTDAHGKRYCYGRQPAIALWNLERLSEALAPLVEDRGIFQQGLEMYQVEYQKKIREMLAKKFGLVGMDDSIIWQLFLELDSIFRQTEIDYTLFYRLLSQLHNHEYSSLNAATIVESMSAAFYSDNPPVVMQEKLLHWIQKYFSYCRNFERRAIQEKMDQANPYFIVRNYLAQQAIEGLEKGNREILEKLIVAMKNPYVENKVTKEFFCKRPEWARNKPGSAMLSCSS